MKKKLTKQERRNWIDEVATYLINHLKKDGFTIQRYNAYSTNSIYLKVDYGVCNSIRISDHEGKGHLKYRYNVRTDVVNYYKKKDTFMREYYPAKKRYVDSLINDVKKNRQRKMEKFGHFGYQHQMEKAIAENGNNRSGFWSQAEVV